MRRGRQGERRDRGTVRHNRGVRSRQGDTWEIWGELGHSSGKRRRHGRQGKAQTCIWRHERQRETGETKINIGIQKDKSGHREHGGDSGTLPRRLGEIDRDRGGKKKTEGEEEIEADICRQRCGGEAGAARGRRKETGGQRETEGD